MVHLITGASGLIGGAVAQSCIADGLRVRLMGRSVEKLRALYGSDSDVVAWEPASQEFPAEALDGVSVIFHLMGEPIAGRWTRAKKERIVNSRVTSAHKIARAMDGRAIRLVSASSFAAYPGRRGDIYDETSPLGVPGQTFIQTTLRGWENAALSGATEASKVTVVRLGLVAAPGGYPKKLARLFARGLGFIAGDGEQIVPLVDIDDAVAMMRWAGAGQAGEGVINCVAGTLPRFREVAEIIAARLHKPTRMQIPEWLARQILGGSGDYFLKSYDMRAARALAAGFTFAHNDPAEILARALH